MARHVCMGAMMRCSFGMTPSPLVVPPVKRVLVGGSPAANIQDHAPVANIPPFGMCMSPLNPTVIAATTAALGVPTPMPCIPVTPAPWVVGAPTVVVGGAPALDDQSRLMCTWGGIIQIIQPGQLTVEVP
ncbi:DUF4280 domain-containing protein [Archangium violaceum]|uniref:DUF4280 domain-containing protein n=1 Tax=Archangium violaceum TaxID=83451 RepID=UPI00193BD9FA|nr:DUF4280 domain-containing protein [Archangium violaceum]QRK05074.1 DUF4280 domain-containing protein [Archangium violaceum]